MKDERYCATCANWKLANPDPSRPRTASSETLGECHRYAPRPVVADRDTFNNATTVWPVTRADNVCGEWFYGGPSRKTEPPTEPVEGTAPKAEVKGSA
jgi:hypothetical protein